MSNIRTLDNLRERNSGPAQRSQMQLRNPGRVAGGAGSGGLFGGMDGVQEKHPRKEHYFDMWTTTFCPNFTIWSFTFLNVIIQLIIFIGSLIYTSTTDQGLNEKWFLGNALETLQDFGMRMPWRIKEEAEIHRLVLSLYVNHGFSQVIINSLGQLFAGFMLEAQMGTPRMVLFWFASAISANFFAATIDDQYATGAEPALFAMLAGLIAMYVYFWDRLGGEEDFCRKTCGLFMMIFLLVLGIFFLTSFAAPYNDYTRQFDISYPDALGFLGGALFGFPFAWVCFKPTAGSISKATRRERGLFMGGLVWVIFLLVILISVFAFSYDPKVYWYIDSE